MPQGVYIYEGREIVKRCPHSVFVPLPDCQLQDGLGVPEPRRTAWYCSVCHPYDGRSRDFAVGELERLARANALLQLEAAA